MRIRIRKQSLGLIIYSLLVLFIAYFTYFRNYAYPPNMFWDENYHIASAYKYLNGVMFMEPHPPLGKFLIALGEYIFHPNSYVATASFLVTDYVKDTPVGFSFVGVRFFPVLLATFSAVLFFFILVKIAKNSYVSFLFSSLYLFDNALIVHSRGAMLESIQIFFILSAILYFLILLDEKKISLRSYFWLGMLAGLALSVKLNGSLLLLVFFPLFFYKEKVFPLPGIIKKFFLDILIFFFGAILIFLGAYYIHSVLGQHVLEKRYYNASRAYRQILQDKHTNSLWFFPAILRDNLLYIRQYEATVPKYDANKVGENGSLSYTWPIGDKAINYRWESNNGLTRYLYLQVNPLIWLFGLLGVISSCLLIFSVVIFKRSVRNKKLFFLLIVFLSFYSIYMCATFTVPRVMYLYHYFIPLLFSLFLSFVVYLYLFEAALMRNDKKLFFVTALFIILIVLVYWFFSPLTYYQPLTKAEFLMRSWLPFWHLVAE